MEMRPVRYDTLVTIRAEQSFKRKIDDIRANEADVPPRAEMIRRLVERAHGAIFRTKRNPEPGTKPKDKKNEDTSGSE